MAARDTRPWPSCLLLLRRQGRLPTDARDKSSGPTQARSITLFLSLMKRGQLGEAIQSPVSFIKVLQNVIGDSCEKAFRDSFSSLAQTQLEHHSKVALAAVRGGAENIGEAGAGRGHPRPGVCPVEFNKLVQHLVGVIRPQL